MSLGVIPSRGPGHTCLATGEGKDHDIIKTPGVVLVWGVEGQLGRSLLPQVNEERGMDHGDSKTAHPLPFPDQGILQGPLVVALKPQRELLLQEIPVSKLFLSKSSCPELSSRGSPKLNSQIFQSLPSGNGSVKCLKTVFIPKVKD